QETKQTWWLTFDRWSCREIQDRWRRRGRNLQAKTRRGDGCWPLRRCATGRRRLQREKTSWSEGGGQRRGGELPATNMARSDSLEKGRKVSRITGSEDYDKRQPYRSRMRVEGMGGLLGL
ncbi:hypothetical protein PIB30_102161, partial [Stylosanthes scabra]|nr:hypothetical protein [Stylosanthes scabra]